MKRLVITLFILAVLVVSAWAANPFVTVPNTTWQELSPYLEANIRVEYVGDVMTVGASSHPFARQLFEPYDPKLGEFASVLLVEGLRESKTQKLVQRAVGSLKASGVDPASMSRDELTSAYWRELQKHEQFNMRMKKLFRKSQAKGRLECLICSEGFDPQHVEVQ